MKKKIEASSKKTAAAPPLEGLKKLKGRLGLFIAIFSFALYAQSISFNYAYDDPTVLTKNNLVMKGFAAIPDLLKTDYLYGLNDESVRVPEYRPVPMIIFATQWQLFPNSPHFYHLMNVLFYSLTCWLLFLLLCKLFKNENLLFPFICALLFAAHPIHTEVVDNIKSLDEILCFLFSIFSILLFIKANDKRPILNLTLGFVFYFFSLLSKETAISYLIIIPITLFVFSNATSKRIAFVTLGLAIVAGVSLLLRYKVSESITESRMDSLHSPYMNSLLAASDLISQKATAFYVLLRYILLLLFPFQLSSDYSFAQIPMQQISNPIVLFSIICYLFMGIYAILKIRKKSIAAFAILFYLLTLVPVSNVIVLIFCTMAERFLFMPSLGFCMLLTFLLMKFWKTDTRIPLNFPSLIKNYRVAFFITIILVSFYSVRTLARNPDWKNNTALFTHDVKVVPNSARMHCNNGVLLLHDLYSAEKNPEKKADLLRRGIVEVRKGLDIYNDLPEAYSDLGVAYLEMDDYTNAIVNYETAIKLFKSLPPSFVYCDLGLAYSNTGQYDKALSILDSSLKYYPNYTDAYVKKSHVYLIQGKNMEDIAECDKLLQVELKNIFGYINKGWGYLNLKEYTQAIEYFNKGLNIDPMNTDCLHGLGVTYQMKGDSVNANAYYQKENEVRSKL